MRESRRQCFVAWAHRPESTAAKSSVERSTTEARAAQVLGATAGILDTVASTVSLLREEGYPDEASAISTICQDFLSCDQATLKVASSLGSLLPPPPHAVPSMP